MLHERLVACLPDPLRDLLHRPLECFRLPVIAVRRTVKYLGQAAGVDRILERGRSLGAERPMINGTIRIALDINNLAIFDIDVEAAANCTVRAHAMHYLCIVNTWGFL